MCVSCIHQCLSVICTMCYQRKSGPPLWGSTHIHTGLSEAQLDLQRGDAVSRVVYPHTHTTEVNTIWKVLLIVPISLKEWKDAVRLKITQMLDWLRWNNFSQSFIVVVVVVFSFIQPPPPKKINKTKTKHKNKKSFIGNISNRKVIQSHQML